jgi:hypothetical protein
MEKDPRKAFELILDTNDSGYDPLADLEADGAHIDESGGQQGPRTDLQAKALYASVSTDRSSSQRIEDLFVALAPRRRVLLSILAFLDTPKRSDALQQKVEELQTYDSSVYSGYNFSLLLSEAGAIQKQKEDGSAYDEEEEQLPDIVEIDGMKFFKPTDGKQVFWLITDEGRAYLEADDPFGRLAELLAEEPQYHVIYKNVLGACGADTGKTGEQLAKLIDNDPLVQEPRRYSSYFVKKLEDCSALEWAKTWRVTDVGKKGLELLFLKDDKPSPEQKSEHTTGKEQS